MSDKRRRKLENRQRRATKKDRQQGARVDKTLPCPNCGDRYRPDPQPEAFHRAGPCDCDAVTRKAMDAFLEKRFDEYESAKNGRIACRTCSTMHGEDKQQTIFVEGRLVWDGCVRCVKERAAQLQAIFELHRDRWFGPDRPRGESSDLAPSANKFIAPFLAHRESIGDSVQIYGGSTARGSEGGS